MTSRTVDVVVIGAGPAGATAARLLAEWGHDVHLIGRAPSRRTLAESLPPSCVRLLTQLGVGDAIAQAGFVKATGNTVKWGNGAVRAESFAPGAFGLQVRRDVFDELLGVRARGSGCGVVSDTNVRAIERTSDGTTITYGDQRVRARWVIDCSGRTGVVARSGWRRNIPSSRTMAIVGVWNAPKGFPVYDPTHTVVESLPEGWAWSVPVSDTMRYVTLMVDPAQTDLEGRAHLARVYAVELARTSLMSALVANATLDDTPWACDASPYTATRFGERGALLAGDAASFVDPLSSFGIKKALASAWLAAVVVHSCLRNASIASPALELFDNRERAMFDALRAQAIALARTAAGSHDTEFWSERADQQADAALGEPDVAKLRDDPAVLAAFAELKVREAVALTLAPGVTRAAKATVRGHELVLLEHLVTPRFPSGIRYLRGVDLSVLSGIAVQHDQVPDIYDAYIRAAPPVPLPDFLGALSVLVGTRALDLGPPPG